MRLALFPEIIVKLFTSAFPLVVFQFSFRSLDRCLHNVKSERDRLLLFRKRGDIEYNGTGRRKDDVAEG